MGRWAKGAKCPRRATQPQRPQWPQGIGAPVRPKVDPVPPRQRWRWHGSSNARSGRPVVSRRPPGCSRALVRWASWRPNSISGDRGNKRVPESRPITNPGSPAARAESTKRRPLKKGRFVEGPGTLRASSSHNAAQISKKRRKGAASTKSKPQLRPLRANQRRSRSCSARTDAHKCRATNGPARARGVVLRLNQMCNGLTAKSSMAISPPARPPGPGISRRPRSKTRGRVRMPSSAVSQRNAVVPGSTTPKSRDPNTLNPMPTLLTPALRSARPWLQSRMRRPTAHSTEVQPAGAVVNCHRRRPLPTTRIAPKINQVLRPPNALSDPAASLFFPKNQPHGPPRRISPPAESGQGIAHGPLVPQRAGGEEQQAR